MMDKTPTYRMRMEMRGFNPTIAITRGGFQGRGQGRGMGPGRGHR